MTKPAALVCQVAGGCPKPLHSHGFCSMHYSRFVKNGDPMVTGRIRLSPGASLEDRFWSKVAEGANGCWQWIGARTGAGYGNFWNVDRNTHAHRWSYEAMVGEIPDGLDIDHLCRNRACVNPWHLEPVTRKVNSLRGMSPMILVHLARKRAASC